MDKVILAFVLEAEADGKPSNTEVAKMLEIVADVAKDVGPYADAVAYSGAPLAFNIEFKKKP